MKPRDAKSMVSKNVESIKTSDVQFFIEELLNTSFIILKRSKKYNKWKRNNQSISFSYNI